MRAREFINEKKDQQVDEFLPALAAGALRGATALGGAIARGAGAVGNAVVKGASTAANAVGNVAKTGSAAVTSATKNINTIKNSLSGIKNVLQSASGSNIDVNKLSQTLATQTPGQTLDPAALKALQSMIPALADALKNPTSAATIKQALSTGVSLGGQDQQQTQQKPQSVGSVGSSPNTQGSA